PEETALAVLGDDVRRGAEPAREVPALGRVEVEADASLAAILVVEHPRAVRTPWLGRQPAGEVRARLRLDLDHLRAEVAEQPAQLRDDRADAEIHDPETDEHRTVRRSGRRDRRARRERRPLRGRGRSWRDDRGPIEATREDGDRRVAEGRRARAPEV